MNRLLAYYEQIADAPDAISRLRRFVLDLAVRGKLVPQDPNDEPASGLVKRITQEKARLVKAGEIKAEMPVPPFGGIESPLPSGWSEASLSDISVCLDYRRKPINATEREKRIEGKDHDQLFPYYGATQQQGWIDAYLFDEELILLGEDGVPFFDPLRPKAYLISGRTWVNNHAHVFKGVLISNAFLMHYLNVFDYTGRVAGATRSKLNQARALDIPVALPPLAEQHRIVAKVDELMALCDRLEAARVEREAVRDRLSAASLARLNTPDPETFRDDTRFALDALPALTARPDQIKQLRQTILNLAVRGKLVPQDANDEPAADLLQRIAVAREKLIAAGEAKRAKSDEEIALPFSIPSTWEWRTLGRLSRLVTKGSSPKWQGVSYVDRGNGLLFVTSENVGKFRLQKLDELKYVEAHFAQIEPRSMLQFGDLLITLVGASIGRTAVYDLNEAANINQAVALVRLVDSTLGPNVDYLLLYLNSDAAVNRMLGDRVTTAQPNISLADVSGFPIPVPPLAEQHRIVAKVNELTALCDALEASLTDATTARTRLLEATLAAALAPIDELGLAAAE